MEPDLYVFTGAPARVSGAYAGDYIVGPSQGEGRRKRIPRRGKKTRYYPLGTISDCITITPLQCCKTLMKLWTIITFWCKSL